MLLSACGYGYVQQGAPPAASPGPPESRPGPVTPHAAGLALIIPLATEAITNLQRFRPPSPVPMRSITASATRQWSVLARPTMVVAATATAPWRRNGCSWVWSTTRAALSGVTFTAMLGCCRRTSRCTAGRPYTCRWSCEALRRRPCPRRKKGQANKPTRQVNP
jgi:hypothetical protein